MKQTKKKYEDPTWRDWVSGITLIVIFLVLIGVGGFLLIPDYWYVWLLLVVASTLLLTLNQTRNYGYRCRDCGHEFSINYLTNLTSPHGIDKRGSWLWLKCPSCEKKGKVSVIRVVKDR